MQLLGASRPWTPHSHSHLPSAPLVRLLLLPRCQEVSLRLLMQAAYTHACMIAQASADVQQLCADPRNPPWPQALTIMCQTPVHPASGEGVAVRKPAEPAESKPVRQAPVTAPAAQPSQVCA